MDPAVTVVGSVAQILGAFGLSSAAGLNAYIPLLALGLLGRFGVLHLQGTYAQIATVPVLAVLGVLTLVDFVADKVPGVDHAAHAVGVVVAPIAGAIVFATQTHAIAPLPPPIALALGFLLAGGFHAARAAARPVITASTAGMGNAAVSLAEDGVSVALSLLGVFAPFVAFGILAVLVWAAARTWKTLRARFSRRTIQ